MIEQELYHFGILGMHWGQHKAKNEVKSKSKHRIKLEETYKSYGLSKKDAEEAANKRIKKEKTAAIVAGTTVAACAAYIANKKLKERVDQVIKKGSKLQRIEVNDDGLHDVFYASIGKHDNKRYKNVLGFTRKQAWGKAYVMELSANKNVKVASQHNANRIFNSLMNNDSKFKNDVNDFCDLSSIKGNKKKYEEFNRKIVNMNGDKGYEHISNKFFKALQDKGYGAIQDVNDMKYSNYNSRNPLIFFGNKKSNNIMQKTKVLAHPEISSYVKEMLKIGLEQDMKKIVPLTAVIATGKTIALRYTKPKKPNNKNYRRA